MPELRRAQADASVQTYIPPPGAHVFRARRVIAGILLQGVRPWRECDYFLHPYASGRHVMCGKFTAMASWRKVWDFSQPLTAGGSDTLPEEIVTYRPVNG